MVDWTWGIWLNNLNPFEYKLIGGEFTINNHAGKKYFRLEFYLFNKLLIMVVG